MSEAKRPVPSSRGGKKRARKPEKDGAGTLPETAEATESVPAPETSKWEPTPAEPAVTVRETREEERKEMSEPPSEYRQSEESEPRLEPRRENQDRETRGREERGRRDFGRDQDREQDQDRHPDRDQRDRGYHDPGARDRDLDDEDDDDRDYRERDEDRDRDERDYRGARSERGERSGESRSERLDLQPRIPPPQQRRGEQSQGGRARPSDEYAFQVYYDRNARTFTGGVLEFPEIRVTGYDRQEVMDELEVKLEQTLRNSRERAPEAFFSRRYPERLEVRISAGLFRRLDVCSRQEKIPLDQLVSEMLAGALEKRYEPSGKGHQHHQQHHQQHHHQGGRQQHHQQQGGGQRRGGGGGGGQQQRQPRGKAYQDTMNNRENFMEYVRNLEKSGGGAGEGRWRKK